MKKYSLILILALPLLLSFTFVNREMSFHGIVLFQDGERDGSSYEKAIIIQDSTESAGIKAEYKWLNEHYPGYKMKKQSLSFYKGKAYDILQFKYKGKKKKIYFDISNFFGKW